MPCSLSGLTSITHSRILLLLQSWSGETELLVSAGPSQSLFIQVNHALMCARSLSERFCLRFTQNHGAALHSLIAKLEWGC